MTADAAPVAVLIAPDSFKGSLDAHAAADELARGWRERRPDDDLRTLPLADGGEGTADVLAAAHPGSRWLPVRQVSGPNGRPVDAPWLLLPDGTGVVELARSSGLGLMARPDPMGATTLGLGQVLAAAARHPEVRRLVVTLGGSASTDGGGGALVGLGARLLDGHGTDVRLGATGLVDVAEVDLGGMLPPPEGGVSCLVDVSAPLLGEHGAARQFAPQKGANPEQVDALERALTRWSAVLGAPSEPPGSGAAGGTAYGLAGGWGARLVPGADAVARAAGLDEALAWADLVVSGEGSFDTQSLGGKVVGHVLGRARAHGVPAAVVAGRVELGVAPPDVRTVSLTALAGTGTAAMADPRRWLRRAGAELAAAVPLTLPG